MVLLISWSGWILKNLCLCFYSPDHLSLVPGQILLAGQVREFWNYLHVLALVDFRFLHCSSLFIFSSPRSAEPHGSLWDKVILFSLTPWMFRQPTIFPSIFLWALILCNVCIIVALCYVANMVICNHPTTRPTPEATFVGENLKPTCANPQSTMCMEHEKEVTGAAMETPWPTNSFQLSALSAKCMNNLASFWGGTNKSFD